MKKTFLLHLIGIIVFILILTRLDLSKTYEILSNTNILFFVVAVLLLLPIFVIRSIRWNYIKKVQNMNYSIKDSIIMYFSGLYIGLVTPGQLGEFIKVFYLTKDKHPLGKSFLSVFLDRLFDLATLLLLSYLSLLVFITELRQQFYILSIVIIAGLLGAVFLLVNKKLTKKILKLGFSIFIPNKYKEKAKLHFYDFYDGIRLLGKKVLLFAFLLTLFSWLIYLFQIFLLALALDIKISFLYLASSIIIAGLLTLVPISISGIGTRDITLIFFFALLGISKELAVSLSILMLSMFIFMALLGFIAWMINPISSD